MTAPRPATRHAMECVSCGREFDPVATRWLCPHCRFKANCCDGEPLPECKMDQAVETTAPSSSND